MKLISISENLLKKIKKEYKNFNIIEFGEIDITNHILLNEINNMSLSSEIYSFTVNQLEENNFISKQHSSRIFELNKKYLKLNKKKDLIQVDNTLKKYPYQVDLNSNCTSSISDITNYYSSYYEEDFFKELFEYNYNGIGKGELFLGMLSQLKKSSLIGDLKINEENIEVKADFSRFKHVNGYNSVRIAWNYFKQEILNKLNNNQLLIEEYKLEDPNTWNFNKSTIDWIINRFQKLIKLKACEYEQIFDLLFHTFKMIYTDISEALLTKYIDKLIDDIKENKGQEFLDNFLILQFDYYQHLTKFNYMILIDKSKYLILKDPQDLKSKLSFIRYSSFSWKEDRNCVFSVSLKK